MDRQYSLMKAACFVSAILFWIVNPSQAFVVYTDRLAWEAAVASSAIRVTDAFLVDIPSAQSITFDSGIISTNSAPPTLPDANNSNSVSSGRYRNGVGGATSSSVVSWTFPVANVMAVGADWFGVGFDRLALVGDFGSENIQHILVHNTIGSDVGFLGVVSSGFFSSIALSNSSGFPDNFSIENIYFAYSTESSISEPEVSVMIGMFFAALLFMTKRNRTPVDSLSAILR